MLSLLRLNGVQLEQLSIKARPVSEEHAEDEVYAVTLTHSAVPTEDEQSHAQMRLEVRLRPEKNSAPVHSYREVVISLIGRFSFNVPVTDEIAAKLYPVTAVAMLFGIARGVVAQATGLCPAGTFLLPPLNVTEAATRKRLSGDCILRRSAGAVSQDTGSAIQHAVAAPAQ